MSNDNYQTDEWLLKLFDGWFDPCPLNPTWDLALNGLEREWLSRTFVNPPYSNPLPWVQKAIEEHEKGKVIALLLKHDSSTRWYRLLHEAGAKFLMVQGRLKHQTNRSANFPSVLVILAKEEE
jgi:hypothetical protein